MICPGFKFYIFFTVLVASSFGVVAANNISTQVREFETNLVALDEREQSNPKRWTIEQRLDANKVPGMSVAIIQDYEVVWVSGYGTKQVGKNEPVDKDTLFSVGSVSKMVNAGLILRLVTEGKLDLDEDVNTYLKQWKVEENRYTRQEKVSLRTILSHSAGFNVHGFRDFMPGEDLPTVLDTLNGARPAYNSRLTVGFVPGTGMDYSGGGIALSQLLVTDVLDSSYNDAAKQYVFSPLGMARSTFENPVPAALGNIAHAHNERGNPSAEPRGWEAMPEMAASGLWISAEDLAKFVIALLKSYQDDHFLPKSVAHKMMQRQANSWYGIGPRLNGQGATRVFHHGGANNSYRAWIEGHLNDGNGIVILTNGTNGHRLNREIRISAEQAFNWKVSYDTVYQAPDL